MHGICNRKSNSLKVLFNNGININSIVVIFFHALSATFECINSPNCQWTDNIAQLKQIDVYTVAFTQFIHFCRSIFY